MATTWFTSDLHIGHRNILKFSGPLRGGGDVNEHDRIVIETIKSAVNKRDILYILGDVCMEESKMEYFDEINCKKILLMGNHDNFKLEVYQKHFESVIPLAKRCGYWLSHAPIHTAELRGKVNIHGHVHASSIRNAFGELDTRYINVCWEVAGRPIKLEEIRDGTYWKIKRC